MIDTLRSFDAGKGKIGFYYSLPALEEKGLAKISRLPVSIRIVLESVLRNCDGKKVAEKDVETLAAWNAKTPAQEEIPFVVARIVLQDFTGVPLLVDLAAMRTAVATLKKNPKIIEPLVPVDLVVDHSVQVDFFGSPDALRRDVEELLAERGLHADHVTVWRWVQRYAPEMEGRLRSRLRPTNDSWRVDETYIRVKGKWVYLYRAVDSSGATIDFLLSAKRDAAAA